MRLIIMDAKADAEDSAGDVGWVDRVGYAVRVVLVAKVDLAVGVASVVAANSVETMRTSDKMV